MPNTGLWKNGWTFVLLLLGGVLWIANTGCAVQSRSPMTETVGKTGEHAAAEHVKSLDTLRTDWTRSYQLYHQPHAIWLSGYERVGINLGTLQQTLLQAEKQNRTPELVVYAIPFRDLGQSSEGGFDTYENYMAENRLLAEALGRFTAKTHLHPRVHLEPDSLGHAIQYRREQKDSPRSLAVYQERIRAMQKLIPLYRKAGARVYLDAAHSGWFDYSEADITAMAEILNLAGIMQADGLTLNVSNRQPVTGSGPNNEAHYLGRLLPKLQNTNLDIIVDTSRNGGVTHARRYTLHPEGFLLDNEIPTGRLVGSWRKDALGETWLHPFFGLPQRLSLLTTKDHYTFDAARKILSAPPWLDAIGDVQPGPNPTNETGVIGIHRFRYIKPPDDCDGSLNCPPGESRSEINRLTAQFQVAGLHASF